MSNTRRRFTRSGHGLRPSCLRAFSAAYEHGDCPQAQVMKEPRRLRLASTGPRADASPCVLSPLRARFGSIAIGETVEGAGAVAFALLLAEAFHARGALAWLALCDFEGLPQLTTSERACVGAHAQGSIALQIKGQVDLAQMIGQSERHADTSAPCLLVGEPALLALEGTLKIVIDPDGAPAGLTPRARRLRQVSHLVLSSPRPGVARLLAEGWRLPTRAP